MIPVILNMEGVKLNYGIKECSISPETESGRCWLCDLSQDLCYTLYLAQEILQNIDIKEKQVIEYSSFAPPRCPNNRCWLIEI